MNASAHRGQRCEIPLELGFQAIVSLLMWVLGIELNVRKSSMCSSPQSHLSSLRFPLCAFFLALLRCPLTLIAQLADVFLYFTTRWQQPHIFNLRRAS